MTRKRTPSVGSWLFRKPWKSPKGRGGPLDLAGERLRASQLAVPIRPVLDQVEVYCTFIGMGHSGSSLVGSLLTAHPEMVIAHELDALRFLQAGFSRDQICGLLVERDASFTQRGRRWGKYQYNVPGQWQGRFERLRVLGDKKAYQSTLQLGAHPKLLRKLRNTMQIPLRFVHVVRNPWDNITTVSKRHNLDLREAARRYFELNDMLVEIRSRLDHDELVEVRHEELVVGIEDRLGEVCAALGVKVDARYLENCSTLLYPSPHTTRHDTAWTDELVDWVGSRVDRYSFLEGYTPLE
ncbi:MAG: sulfotransferase [Actinomycetota bacterium]|nr:sulfotransferase [Actinomycetota bacterium]